MPYRSGVTTAFAVALGLAGCAGGAPRDGEGSGATAPAAPAASAGAPVAEAQPWEPALAELALALVAALPREDPAVPSREDPAVPSRGDLAVLAVRPAGAGGESSDRLAAFLAAMLPAWLEQAGGERLSVYTREHVEAVLAEQAGQQGGAFSEATVAPLGNLLAADHLVLVSVAALEGRYRVSAALVSVATGATLAEPAVGVRADADLAALAALPDLPDLAGQPAPGGSGAPAEDLAPRTTVARGDEAERMAARAAFLRDSGDLEGAITWYGRALARAPEDRPTRAALAATCERAGRLEEADRARATLVAGYLAEGRRDPARDLVEHTLRVYGAAERLDEFPEALGRLLAETPGEGTALRAAAARSLERRGRADLARRVQREARGLRPADRPGRIRRPPGRR